MGKNRVRRQKAKDFYKKVKLIIPKCPHHGVEYEVESSPDPVNEGDWRRFYCKLCRGDR